MGIFMIGSICAERREGYEVPGFQVSPGKVKYK